MSNQDPVEIQAPWRLASGVIGSLLSRARSKPRRDAPDDDQPAGEPSPGTRLYAVGDIHGRLDLLIRLEAKIAADAASSGAERHRIVYLGDYIDRGPEPKGVVDHLIGPPPSGCERILLKGNHEDALETFLDDPSIGPAWMSFGGDSTLFSYGIRPPRLDAPPAAFDKARRELAAKLPPKHRAFYRGLRLSFEDGDFVMVHAGVKPGVALAEQRPNDLLTIREPFLSHHERFEKIVVHGHTITNEPEIRFNRIGVDTGAYYSGRLSCVVAESGRLSILQA